MGHVGDIDLGASGPHGAHVCLLPDPGGPSVQVDQVEVEGGGAGLPLARRPPRDIRANQRILQFRGDDHLEDVQRMRQVTVGLLRIGKAYRIF